MPVARSKFVPGVTEELFGRIKKQAFATETEPEPTETYDLSFASGVRVTLQLAKDIARVSVKECMRKRRLEKHLDARFCLGKKEIDLRSL
jgi:hypothetical protein